MLVHLKIILFLIGNTLTTGHVLRNRMPGRSWNPAANLVLISPKLSYLPSSPIEPMNLSAGSSPSWSNLWPLYTNPFYEPHITMTPDGMPISTEIRQKECDENKESVTFSADINKPLETLKLKPTYVRTEQPPFAVIAEELPQHSPPMEPLALQHKDPVVIPQAPELSSLHIPEIPAPTLMEVAPSSKLEDLTVPHFSEFRPIDIPQAPELPSFMMPEVPILEVPCPYPAEGKPLIELKPIDTTTTTNQLPQVPPYLVSDVSKSFEVQSKPSYYESALFENFRPADTEIKPLTIPIAPELPPLALPKLPAPMKAEIISLDSIETPKQPKEVDVISEFRPLNIASAPEFKRPYLPESSFISSYLPIKSTGYLESEIKPEFKPIHIPAAPELSQQSMPEVPAHIQVEFIPSYTPVQTNLPAKLSPEYKPMNLPASPELPCLHLTNLPAPTEITSNIMIKDLPTSEFKPVKVNIPTAPELSSPAMPELIAPIENTLKNFEEVPASDSQPLRVHIPAAPELPPLVSPEKLTPIEIIPDQLKDSAAQKFNSPGVNIPAAPELPSFTIDPIDLEEEPAPTEIFEKAPAPEIKLSNVLTVSQLPHTETNFIEPYVPESPKKDMKLLTIPPSPELPPLSISELTPFAPVAPLLKETPVQFTDQHPLSDPLELPPFKVHTMEPIIVKGPAASNIEEPCKKDETIKLAFISEAFQRPMMYPVFLAQNIIIERVVPNLYLSHKPYLGKPDSTSHSHPIFSNGNFESEMYYKY